MKSLQIPEHETILKDLTVTEYIDKDLLNDVINYAPLQTVSYGKYENEKHFLLKVQKALTKKNEMKITYTRYGEYGRVYAKEGISLGQVRRELRHTLADGNYIDIDMKNAHPTILKQVCEHNKIKCNYLSEYVNKRDEILKSTMEFYNCSRDIAKRLFISLLYLGSFKTWVTSNCIENEEETDFIKNYSKELSLIANRIIKENFNFYQEMVDEEKHNPKSTVLSLYLQQIECIILETMYSHLLEKKVLGTPKKINVVLCFDGLMIKKDNISNIKELLIELENKIKTKIGYDIKLEVKEFDEKLDMEQLKKDKQILKQTLNKNYEFKNTNYFNAAYCNELEDYELMRKYFGLFFCKVIYPEPLFIHCTYINGIKNINYLSEEKLIATCKEAKIHKEWLKDDQKKIYGRLEFEPINSSEVTNNNPEYYNTFTGYNPQIKTEITNDNIIDSWKKIVFALCEENEENYNYYIKWLADIIQNPSNKKGTCIVLRSNEGCGKGAHLDAFAKVITHSMYFSSSDVDDFFGKFGVAYNNTLLANYNEAKNCHNFIDKIKAYITEGFVTLEKKGVDKIVIKNCTRLIITTNNNSTIEISESNRRFVIFQGTDKYKKKKDGDENTIFWKKFLEIKETPEFVACLYKYLNSIDLSDWDFNKFPRTRSYEETRLKNMKTEISFINEYINENKDNKDNKVKGSVLFDSYRTYCKNGNIKCDLVTIKDFYFNMVSLVDDGIKGIDKISLRNGTIAFKLDIQLIKKSLIDNKYIEDPNKNLFEDI